MELKELKDKIKNSRNEIVIYELENKENENILGIPDNTLLGTIIYNTSYIKINNIIRVFGNIIINEFEKYTNHIPTNYLIVGNDVFGGLFALAGTNIMYFAPDTLEWESLDINFPQFISWIIDGDIMLFYHKFISDEIKAEVEKIDINSAIHFIPFSWTKEFNINTCSRKIIKSDELIDLNFDIAKQINA